MYKGEREYYLTALLEMKLNAFKHVQCQYLNWGFVRVIPQKLPNLISQRQFYHVVKCVYNSFILHNLFCFIISFHNKTAVVPHDDALRVHV